MEGGVIWYCNWGGFVGWVQKGGGTEKALGKLHPEKNDASKTTEKGEAKMKTKRRGGLYSGGGGGEKLRGRWKGNAKEGNSKTSGYRKAEKVFRKSYSRAYG